jgi:hypothetical protein
MDISFPELVNATISMYVRCAKEATQTILKDWLLVIGSVVLFLGFSIAGAFLAQLGMVGGMLISLVGVAALTYYYGWLSELTRSPGGQRRARLDKASLLEFDVSLFFVLISASFVLWVIQWIVGSLILGMNAGWVLTMLSLGLIFLFNSLPETLYVHRYQSLAAFQESFEFTRANWIEWYLPFLVLTSPFLLLGLDQFSYFFATNSPLLPVSMIFQVPQLLLPPGLGVLTALVGVVFANWFMLFRGFLFQELERGTRRQRIFAARQK